MEPTVGEPFAANPDVHVIPTYWPLSEDSVLTINAFLLHAAEPVLVDTGAGAVSADVLDALSSVLRLDRLRWIWLTHEDLDHTGTLDRLLDLAPRARIVSSSSAVTRTEFERPLPADRLHAISPGETLHVGDRTLGALQPPLFDSPATSGFLDQRSGVLFSSDCFGATLPSMAEAAVHSTAELPEDTVAEGQVAWAHSDSPWVTLLDADAFAQIVHRVRRLQPSAILSSHLAPIPAAKVEPAFVTLSRAARTEPAAGFTRSQLESLLAQFESDGSPPVR
jgi:glyoxylase-like metal-dependent hydrolase (beta-lactamase superfamily II)